MMNALAPSLVRRGMSMMKAGDGDEMKQLPGWGVVLLVGTGILFVVAMITVRLQAPLLKPVADNS